MRKKKLTLSLAAAALVLAASCSQGNRWTAEGYLTGAEDKDIVLEAPNAVGGWYAVDTVTATKGGLFKISGEAVGHPEVFRLTVDGKSVYFPIDSVEQVKVEADLADLSSTTKLSGSESAEKLQQVNDLLAKVVSEKGEAAVAYDPDLKRALAEVILRDPSGIAAYYTIFRRVGNTPVYNFADRSDLRIVGAVANAFSERRPSDPRTKLLTDMYLANRRAFGYTGTPTDTIAAQEVVLPEIALYDREGKVRSLNEVASHGKVVVLNFTAYTSEASPAYNIELANLYREYADKGVEIYQVSVDGDEFQWKQSARNLPWITVYNSPKDGDAALRSYNVQAIPMSFVINRKGELTERVANPAQLASTVSRYL